MKRNPLMRLLAVLVSLILLSVAVITVSYAEGTDQESLRNRLFYAQSFKFMQHKDGIGTTDAPVYLAPVTGALRLANGRQAVDLSKEIYDAGFTEHGWLLVRYDPGNGYIRCGYIPQKYVKNFQSSMSIKNFDYIPAVSAAAIGVTDNPSTNGTDFTTLNPGDRFYILAKYTYSANWWYIECTVGGKTARGFIDRDTAAFWLGDEELKDQEPITLSTLGSPDISPLGTSQKSTIMIDGNDKDPRKQVHRDANPDSTWISVVYPGHKYPVYETKTGTNGDDWYYVFVEEDSVWGWIPAVFASVQ